MTWYGIEQAESYAARQCMMRNDKYGGLRRVL
jgi:hypothetical protein